MQGRVSSIPGWGAMIPHASQSKNQNKKQKLRPKQPKKLLRAERKARAKKRKRNRLSKILQQQNVLTDFTANTFFVAKAIHKSEMSVKTALAALEDHALILRKRQGVGKANRIYVKLPVDRNLSARQTENCPSDGKKTVCHMERKLSGNKNKESKTNKSKRRSKGYGKFQNVFLSDGDMDSLRRTVPQYRDYIERLSTYMQSSGKRYADHAATIKSWYLRDNPPPPARNYESEENESL